MITKLIILKSVITSFVLIMKLLLTRFILARFILTKFIITKFNFILKLIWGMLLYWWNPNRGECQSATKHIAR